MLVWFGGNGCQLVQWRKIIHILLVLPMKTIKGCLQTSLSLCIKFSLHIFRSSTTSCWMFRQQPHFTCYAVWSGSGFINIWSDDVKSILQINLDTIQLTVSFKQRDQLHNGRAVLQDQILIWHTNMRNIWTNNNLSSTVLFVTPDPSIVLKTQPLPSKLEYAAT